MQNIFTIKYLEFNNKFVFLLKHINKIVGRVSFIRYNDDILIIDCYIVKEYRRKWFKKYFSINLFKLALSVSKSKKYKIWITFVANKLSVPILKYYGFKAIKNNLYRLNLWVQ